MSMPVSPARQRCAIYTRKSTDDRFDRDFNSIESQRDICSAYITCQSHKGWAEVSRKYDGPGQSGATIDRPALQQLMRDIEAGRIDVIVIYKIDRLTRTLADFIRLMEVFDRYQVSFVSVTQSFDTTDSMGRLVLNILLTFAQFERELIADRNRDKVAAMKRRGKHTGGIPPYGYDVVDRRLVVNRVEAPKVRTIFRRYLELGSYRAVCIEFQGQGFRSKQWISRSGKVCGGKIASNGLIYHILGSPIYVGRVPHNETSYPGEHKAIIDQETWDAAQALRASRSMHAGNLRPSPSILLGLFHDSHGRRMVNSTQYKGEKHYRYYLSEQSRWGTREGVKQYRTAGKVLKELVIAVVKETLSDRQKVRAAVLAVGRGGADLDRLPRAAVTACDRLQSANLERQREMVHSLIVRGEISQARLVLVFRFSELVRSLSWDGIAMFRGDRPAWALKEPTLTVERPLNDVRHERGLVMPIEPVDAGRRRRLLPGLVTLIEEARRAQAALMVSAMPLLTSLLTASSVHRETSAEFSG